MQKAVSCVAGKEVQPSTLGIGGLYRNQGVDFSLCIYLFIF